MRLLEKIGKMPAWKFVFIFILSIGFIVIGVEEYLISKAFSFMNRVADGFEKVFQEDKDDLDEMIKKDNSQLDDIFNQRKQPTGAHLEQTQKTLGSIHKEMTDDFERTTENFKEGIKQQQKEFNKFDEDLKNVDQKMFDEIDQRNFENQCRDYFEIKAAELEEKKAAAKFAEYYQGPQDHPYVPLERHHFMDMMNKIEIDDAIKNKKFNPSKCRKYQ